MQPLAQHVPPEARKQRAMTALVRFVSAHCSSGVNAQEMVDALRPMYQAKFGACLDGDLLAVETQERNAWSATQSVLAKAAGRQL